MTTKELANFRSVLEARQTELEALLRNREVIAVNLSSDVLDQIQHAQGSARWRLATSRRASAHFRVKCEPHSNGYRARDVRDLCGVCEEEVSLKRLAALPWATQCWDAGKPRIGMQVLSRDTIEESKSTRLNMTARGHMTIYRYPRQDYGVPEAILVQRDGIGGWPCEERSGDEPLSLTAFLAGSPAALGGAVHGRSRGRARIKPEGALKAEPTDRGDAYIPIQSRVSKNPIIEKAPVPELILRCTVEDWVMK